MKRYKGIDYCQRPKSYWDDQDVLTALLANVKGSERRQMIRVYWEQGRLDELGDVILKDTLDEDEREYLGQIHPIFMGGEYLPDYKLGEVEIARIELRSTTRDVISVRARKRGRRIGYRIVDEYDTGFPLQRETSVRPLSLAELIRLLETSGPRELPSGLILGYNELSEDSVGREYLRDFTSVSSEFYPDLGQHCACVISDWVADEPRTSPQAAE